MGKVVIWVDFENYKRIDKGLSAKGFPNQSTDEEFQLILPLSAVYYDEEIESFIILEKQEW